MIQWHTGAKRVETLAFSPDGQTLVSSNYKRTTVKRWRPDGTPLGHHGFQGTVRDVAFSPDGRHLAVSWGWGPLWVIPVGGGTAARLTAPSACYYLAFAPTGNLLVSVSDGGLIGWERPAEPTPDSARPPDSRWETAPHGVPFPHNPTFTPDGRRLVLNARHAGGVFEVPPVRCSRRLIHPTAGDNRTSVAVSPDGRLVAASHSRNISVWQLATDDPPRLLPGLKPCRSVPAMRFLSDGALLAVGSDGVARLWDTDAGDQQQAWDFGLKNLQALAVAPDGLTAAVGTHDGRILVWDL